MWRKDHRKSKRRRHEQSYRAFTLIELLVVVVITAFMIGMLIPSLKKSMRLAARTVCKSQIKQISECLHLYRIENSGWLPPFSGVSPRNWNPHGESGAWFTKLYPTYINEPLVLSCPDDPARLAFLEQVQKTRTTRIHRLNRPAASDSASYGINGFIVNAAHGAYANLDRHQPTRPLDTILLADMGPDDGPERLANLQNRTTPLRNVNRLSWDDGYDPFSILPNSLSSTGKSWLTSRHFDGVNVSTIDGGVRDVRTQDVIRGRIMSYYAGCASAGCTFCNEFRVPHYSFSRSRLYWWTGPAPTE